MSDLERSSNLVIPADRVPVAAYQAIYHRLTKKTEKLQKSFEGAFKLTRLDLEDLYQRIQQSVGQYQVKAQRCEISITLAGNESYSYSSFERFNSINTSAFAAATLLVVIEYDFLIVLPSELEEAADISQRYKLRVNFGKSNESRRVYTTRPFEILELSSSVNTYIEYADFAVARHLQALLTEWVQGLEYRDEGTLSPKACAMIRSVAGWTVGLMVISALIAGIVFEFPDYVDIVTPVRYLLSVILIAVLALIAGLMLESRLSNWVRIVEPSTIVLLTAGDQRQHNESVHDRRKAKFWIGFLLSGVLLAFVISIFANYVSARLFGAG